jgi:RHS repeat-associated protein
VRWSAAFAAVSIAMASLASSAGSSSSVTDAMTHESPAVRAELAHLVASKTPQYDDGSSEDTAPPKPTGRLVPELSTSRSKTYALPEGIMATWTRPTVVSASTGSEPSPAWSESGFSPSCTLTSTAPSQSSCNQTTMSAGYDSTSKTTKHALIEFSTGTFVPPDATILFSKFKLHVASTTTSNTTSIGAYPITTNWQPGATWNTTDGAAPWKTGGGDFSSGNDAWIHAPRGGGSGWVEWLPSQAMQEWSNTGNAPAGQGLWNYGFLLKQATDGEASNVYTFDTPSEGENAPILITYWIPRGMGVQSQFSSLSVELTDKASVSVNLGSGNLLAQNSDLSITGRGLSFAATRSWNSLDSDFMRIHGFGYQANNEINLLNWPWDGGSVSFRSGSGAWFQFHKQGASFLTPAGINATMCAPASPKPCPATLPAGVAYRLIDNSSQDFIDFKPSLPESQVNHPLDYRDHYGNTISVGYSECCEHPTSWTDTEGRTIETSQEKELDEVKVYTALHDVSGGRSVEYGYNESQTEPQLTSYTDANGKKTLYGYSGRLMTSITTPGKNVVKFEYDGEKRVTKIIRTTNAEHTTGPTITFTYYTVGSAPAPCTAKQKATVVKDPDGNTGKAGHTTTYCVNTLDEVEKTVDANGNESAATYNPQGNVTSSTAAAPGNLELGNIESHIYDEAGFNLMCDVTGTSEIAKSTCPAGPPSKTALVTGYNYKDENNPFFGTQVKNPEANSLFACYNGGKQTGSEGPACPTTATGPPGTLETENNQLPEQHELSFAYNNADGTLSSSTDADGHTTTYEYDGSGNLSKINPPIGSTLAPMTVSVDADSRPEVETDGAGHVATVTYDDLDRVTKLVYSGAGTPKTIKLTYEADGNLTKREDSTGITKYTVDKLNRVTKETLPDTQTNKYVYDDASNLTSFADASGTTKYVYNGLNELESMKEPTAVKSTTFSYDNDHRLTGITYPSGVKEVFKLEATTGRPESITAEGILLGAVPALSYSYKRATTENVSGLVQKLSESSGNTTEYGYDKLDRLLSAVTTGTNASLYSFKLDGVGNRSQQTVNLAGSTGGETTYFAYNAGNELVCRQTTPPPCSEGSSELTHYLSDAAGELTSIAPRTDGSGNTFGYNSAQQTETITPAGSGARNLAYGGAGQDDLVGVGEAGLKNSLLGLTSEVNSGGSSYFARTPNGLLIDERTPSGNFNPMYDGQGDIIALVGASGVVERSFRYGPYGENVVSDKAEGAQGPPFLFGFQGGYRMPGGNKGKGNVANGLYHFGARYYDPTVGRWTQPDPQGGFGSYAFVQDDPVNQADPSGEMGASGWQYYAAKAEVRWCVHHPWAFYHTRSVYLQCKRAAVLANPGSDECHAWGFLIGLAGAESLIPASRVVASLPGPASSVLKALGLGQVFAC